MMSEMMDMDNDKGLNSALLNQTEEGDANPEA